jgi:dUTP pyrophosphatase
MRVGFDQEFENMKVVNAVLDDDTAQLPKRADSHSAGYDLYAHINGIEELGIMPGETIMIGTGVHVRIPNGYFGGIFARSGLATKKGLRPANCVGVIDETYTGEIMVALHNDSKDTQVIKNGERIAQLVIIPYATVIFNEVDELEKTDRGESGFGSTGTM